MSRKITQPVNQVRLTNVAVVRMNRRGKRFEVACYRNKIVNYRQGIETDLSEVLQTDRVFANVSRGEFANTADLRDAFDLGRTADPTGDKDGSKGGIVTEEDICKLILLNGQIQISDRERSAQLEATQKEVAAMVANKCVDPARGRPYTINQIREGMREAGFMVHPSRSVKQQFLDCVRLLKERGVMRIERAKMELCVDIEEEKSKGELVRALTDAGAIIDDKASTGTRIVFQIDPALYRTVDKIARDSGGRLQILRQTVTVEGDAGLGSELMDRQRDERRDQDQQPAAAASSSSDEDDDAVVKGLAERMQTSQISPDSEDEEGDARPQAREDDIPTAPEPVPPVNSRKQQKKAAKAQKKKSKKAKRREKEEAAERAAKVEAERERRRERAERLGIDIGEEEGGAAAAADTASDAGSGAATPQAPAPAPGAGGGNSDVKSCNTCGGSFLTPALYRAHFRSDWHRYNIKLKMKGCTPVTEEEFKLCDSDAFF